MGNLYKMELPIQDIIRFVTKMVSPDRSVLVGIDGGAGAGKTTFTRLFAESIRQTMISVSVVHTDHVYRPVAERWTGSINDMPIGYDQDWERLRDQVIIPLWLGKPTRLQLYDWPEDRLKDWMMLDIGGITIVDGVLSTRNELSDYYDLRVWFSCPSDIRAQRMMGRGDTLAREIRYWEPIWERYITAHKPEERAHLIVDSAADISNGWSTKQWLPPNIA